MYKIFSCFTYTITYLFIIRMSVYCSGWNRKFVNFILYVVLFFSLDSLFTKKQRTGNARRWKC